MLFLTSLHILCSLAFSIADTATKHDEDTMANVNRSYPLVSSILVPCAIAFAIAYFVRCASDNINENGPSNAYAPTSNIPYSRLEDIETSVGVPLKNVSKQMIIL